MGKLEAVVKGRDWLQVEEHVRQLEQKVQDELTLAQQRHEVHVDLFKQEETKVSPCSRVGVFFFFFFF